MVDPATERYEQVLLSAPSEEAGPANHLVTALRRLTSLDLDPIEVVGLWVAAPALIGFTAWLLAEAHRLGLERLAFLARDGQVCHEIAKRLKNRDFTHLTLDYVPSSRRTWNMASIDVDNMATMSWLFSSFMRANAYDLCERLGLDYRHFTPLLEDTGVSLARNDRASVGSAQQLAMQRFLSLPDVIDAVRPIAENTRRLTRELIEQRKLDHPTTGIVDAGWTGVMLSSLFSLIPPRRQPHVFLWGYQPRGGNMLPDDRVMSFHFDLRRAQGAGTKIRDEPFLIETFCMADHGIVRGYRRLASGTVVGNFQSNNPEVEAWGLKRFRWQIYQLLATIQDPSQLSCIPITMHRLLEAFWLSPSQGEAASWATYPYDSDPTGTATRPLAWPFTTRGDDKLPFAKLRGERAWIAGSLALSDPLVARALRERWAKDGSSS